MRRYSQVFFAILVALLVACVSLEAGEGPGPLNQAIRQELVRLGVLEADGSYAGGGGATPTLAEVLAEGSTANSNITMAATRDLLFEDGEGTVYIDAPSGDTLRFGAGSITATGALRIGGGVRGPVIIQSITTGVGSPGTLTSTASGDHINNVGTTVKAACTLPTAEAGLHYYFEVEDADGLRVNAATGDNIRLGDTTSATAGYFESVRVGSSIHLVAVDSTTWQAVGGITGTWRADSTTNAGYAFTPQGPTAYTLGHTWDADADVSEANAYYTHVGNTVTWWGEIRFTGAPPNTSLGIYLPNSWSWATTNDSTGGYSILGSAALYDASPGAIYSGQALIGTTSNRDRVVCYTGGTTLALYSATSPVTWATGDSLWFRAAAQVQ